MSPPLIELEEEGKSNITLLTFPSSMESKCQNGSGLKEHNYMGLSDCSSVDSSTISTKSDDNNESLNLRATELRLGLPGSQSPLREPVHCKISLEIPNAKPVKPLFPLRPSNDNHYSLSMKTVVSGSKRGFSDAMDGFSEEKYADKSQVNALLSPKTTPNYCVKAGAANSNSGTQPAQMKEVMNQLVQERPCGTNGFSNSSSAPATKAQVVGWPPVRSFRKNIVTPLPKKADALFVKVSMDGAPYLRKVDLRNYSAYQELSSALEKLFSCFTIGQCGSPGTPGNEMLSESKLKDLLNGSEYVLTYEDKDSDWMLVGDVPWEMFIDTCKRLRIMKSCDAIGLAPRSVDKLASKN